LIKALFVWIPIIDFGVRMMLRVVGLILFICLLTVVGVAQKNQRNKTSVIKDEILKLEELGRQKVLKGENTWDDLIADGAYMIAADGTIINYQKGQTLPSLPLRSFVMSELIVRVYGEIAIVTGLAEVEGETPDKKPFSFKMRFLNTWKKLGDNWKIVVSERTTVRPFSK
jgi:hypothetical protein